MSHEMWQSIPVPSLNQPFREANGFKQRVLFHSAFIFADMLGPGGIRTKERLLGEDVQALSSLFSEHGVSIPENPYDQVRFLGHLTYLLAVKTFGSEKATLGFVAADNRFGFIDGFAAEHHAIKNNLPIGEIIKHVFIHELIHSSEGLEEQKHRQNGQVIKSRGFRISSPFMNELETTGGHRLNEGLAEFLTDMVRPVPEEIYSPYPGEKQVVAALVDKIGLYPLMQGCYSANGFYYFVRAMNETFGEGSFNGLIARIGAEYESHGEQNEGKDESTPVEYPDTLAFITGSF